jgi:hypothetical protein
VDQFEPAVLRASWNLEIDRVLADAGYDSEPNHRTAREHLGIRSTASGGRRRASSPASSAARARPCAAAATRRGNGKATSACGLTT